MAIKSGIGNVRAQTACVKTLSDFMTAIKRYIGVPALVLAFGGFAFFLLSVGLFFIGGFRFLPRVMAWNLFLAMLPMVFAILVRMSAGNGRKALAVLAGVPWLLFFPNAPYMVTDIIHLRLFEYYGDGVFLRDFAAWAWLLYVATGILLGTMAGMLSMEMIQEEIVRLKNRWTANLMVTAVALVSGYAIYVGRFLRFNSWDIIRPWSLVQRLIEDFDGYSAAFSCMAAVYVLVVYGLFHVVCVDRRQDRHDRLTEKG